MFDRGLTCRLIDRGFDLVHGKGHQHRLQFGGALNSKLEPVDQRGRFFIGGIGADSNPVVVAPLVKNRTEQV